jgi:hypothetical protein
MFVALFLRRRKPAFMLNQSTQIFDLTGVADVAVDDAGETNAQRRQRPILRFIQYSIQIGVRNGGEIGMASCQALLIL